MKKVILILGIVALANTTKAQGNLQFNQVKRITYSGSPTVNTNTTISTITVPSNKVWKIESGSIAYTQSGLAAALGLNMLLLVDNQMIYGYYGGSLYSSPPIWLPTGTYQVIIGNNNTNATSVQVGISAIEYNIIP